MNRLLVAATGMALATSTAASAKIPRINATCPGRLSVHADEGGPVYINGKEAKLKTFSANFYEASQGRTKVSISINPDGSAAVSYTGPGRANGVCTVAND